MANGAKKKIAIVTQDPANRGGVLRLVEYVHARILESGATPVLLHYASFKTWPRLSVSLGNWAQGRVGIRPNLTRYQFEGMDAVAIGAWLPEWEPNRIASNKLWQGELERCDAAFLVTGSAHTGLPLVDSSTKFDAWISSTVEHDRRARLASAGDFASRVERIGLSSVQKSEQAVLSKASKLYAVSNDAALAVGAITSRTPFVLPFPIDTSKFNRASRASNHLHQLLFVGRAGDPRKRIELLLASITEVLTLRPELDVRVSVVTSMPIPEPVRQRYPKAIERIHILQGLSEAELISLYRNSAALILTSEQEGLGIAAMEAMACGTPVISTRCGGPETFINDGTNGFLTSADPRQIGERISVLLTDSELQMRLGKDAARTIDTQFSERIWNAKFVRILEELAG